MSQGFRPMQQFSGTEVRKLYHGDKLIGVIRNLDMDWPNMIGSIELTQEAEPYKPAWEYFIEQGGVVDDVPFPVPDGLLDDWFVEDENGNRSETDLPAVYPDGEIWWSV